MFADRKTAGRQLSQRLQYLRHEKPVVLALPRGGVPVGFEIAEGLDAPLDIVLVRKIGVPWQPELALGAVVDGADPQIVINDSLAAELAIDESYIKSETARQLEEIERRRKLYLGDRPPVPLAGRTVIVVDDGIATGSTVRTALRAIRNAGAGKIVLAVPVAPRDALDELRGEVDEIICLSTPSPFIAVGAHYAEFAQLADADVILLLEERHKTMARSEDSPAG
jgi:putative phosphoribosyl transferase